MADLFIELDKFLKREGIVATGGQAKILIQDGQIQVNGMIETRRGRKLRSGDRVTYLGTPYDVVI
jgi:ribosome-associated protein